jgi:3-isopropylmalate dehydratase small subunit
MKKVAILAVAFFSFAALNAGNELPKNNIVVETPVAASMKVLNDTGSEVTIHTGTGHVTLQKGGSTSFSCDPGKKVSLSNGSKPTKLLFTIEESMCGKTIKLSDYL